MDKKTFTYILHRTQHLHDLIMKRDEYFTEAFYDGIAQGEELKVYRARQRAKIRQNNKKGNYEFRTADVPPLEEEPFDW